MRVRQEGVSPEALYEQGGDLIPATPKQFATLVYAESRKFGAEIEYPPSIDPFDAPGFAVHVRPSLGAHCTFERCHTHGEGWVSTQTHACDLTAGPRPLTVVGGHSL